MIKRFANIKLPVFIMIERDHQLRLGLYLTYIALGCPKLKTFCKMFLESVTLFHIRKIITVKENLGT